MTDSRQETLTRGVHDAYQLQQRLVEQLDGLDSLVSSALPRDFVITVGRNCAELADYLTALVVPDESTARKRFTNSPTSFEGESTPTGSGSSAGASLYADLSYVAINYVALFELALKLFDPRMRDIAQRHLLEYQRAIHTLAAHFPQIIADELSDRGLECHCVCPMCSVGLCGCVEVGRSAAASLGATLHDPAPDVGFFIQRPREGSQLARAGVAKGDHLQSIDGEPVTSVSDIQGAIRKHQIGERFRVEVDHHGVSHHFDVVHESDY